MALDPGFARGGRADDHAQPPRQAQRVQRPRCTRCCAPRSSRRATSQRARGAAHRRGPRLLRRAGPLAAQGRARRGADRPLGDPRLVLQPAGAPPARAAQADRVRGERRRRRRGRQHRARLRHRARGALGELRAVVRAPRPGARFGRHLLPAAPGRHRARHGPRAARRAARGRGRRALGPDLEGGRRRAAHERSASRSRASSPPARPRATDSSSRRCYASRGNSLDAQLDLERDLQREAGFSEDYRKGVAAFMQKRKPSRANEEAFRWSRSRNAHRRS